jgi:predicted Zn finger-like uncharacterized protein
MILTCPTCGTQYVVKDGAIPSGGRQVRCTACKHSWHQEPDGGATVDETPSPSVEPEAVPESQREEESVAEATLIEPRSGPEAEQRAYEEATIEAAREPVAEEAVSPAEPASDTYAHATFDISRKDPPARAAPAENWQEPPEAEAQEDQFSPFAAPDEEQPRRRSPLLTIMIVAIVVIAIAAAFWFLAPPQWKAQLGLGTAGASPLALVTTHMDRQRLESGNELLTVTGRVINPTAKEQSVPPIQAQLKTRAGKVVYSWTIAPPARSLGPGASASFNSAEVNVPPGGDELTISLESSS